MSLQHKGYRALRSYIIAARVLPGPAFLCHCSTRVTGPCVSMSLQHEGYRALRSYIIAARGLPGWANTLIQPLPHKGMADTVAPSRAYAKDTGHGWRGFVASGHVDGGCTMHVINGTGGGGCNCGPRHEGAPPEATLRALLVNVIGLPDAISPAG